MKSLLQDGLTKEEEQKIANHTKDLEKTKKSTLKIMGRKRKESEEQLEFHLLHPNKEAPPKRNFTLKKQKSEEEDEEEDEKDEEIAANFYKLHSTA